MPEVKRLRGRVVTVYSLRMLPQSVSRLDHALSSPPLDHDEDGPSDPFIVAEIGINHNGDIDIVRRMIDVAVSSGCDAVKFQKRTVDIVYSQAVLDQERESPWGQTQRDQKLGIELSPDDYRWINDYCAEQGILWSASAWDLESLKFVEAFRPPFHKVASAMLTHESFIEAVAGLGRPTLISTGMIDLERLDPVVSLFKSEGTPVVLLHSVSTYPANEADLNLMMMRTLRKRYDLPIGYSGHEASVSPSIIAVASGAKVLERHVTLDRSMYGSDQSASLEESGLRQLVSSVRKIPVVMGDGVKRWVDGEREVAAKLRYWE